MKIGFINGILVPYAALHLKKKCNLVTSFFKRHQIKCGSIFAIPLFTCLHLTYLNLTPSNIYVHSKSFPVTKYLPAKSTINLK